MPHPILSRPSLAWPALLAATLFSVLLAASAFRSPSNNFDLIGYVASVYAQQTDNPARLHELTYTDIKQSIPVKDFTILTETPGYIATVHNDPEALKQQIPFYAIRHAYTQLISVVANFGMTITNAVFLVSSLFAGGAVFIIFLMFGHFKISLYLIPFIAFPLGVREVGSLASPDSMALFFSLLAYYLWLQPAKVPLYISLLICILMPFIRTDYIIFSLLVFAFSLKRATHIALAGMLLSLLIFWATGKLAHGYSYLTLFQHQFVQLLAYPAQVEYAANLMEYLDGYFYSLYDSIKGNQTLLYIIAIYIFIADRVQCRTILKNPNFNIPFLFFLLHFLLFPSFYPRHFVFSSLLIFIQIMQLIMQAKSDTGKEHPVT